MKLLIVSALFAYSYAFVALQTEQQQTIWQIIDNIASETNETESFRSAVEDYPAMRDFLAGNASMFLGRDFQEPRITVFVPINSAFGELPQNLQQAIGQVGSNATNVSTIQAGRVVEGLLAYHIIEGAYNLTGEPGEMYNAAVPTLLRPLHATFITANQTEQPPQDFNQEEVDQAAMAPIVTVLDNLQINSANILTGYEASNGYVYLIDSVISPLWYANVTLSDL